MRACYFFFLNRATISVEIQISFIATCKGYDDFFNGRPMKIPPLGSLMSVTEVIDCKYCLVFTKNGRTGDASRETGKTDDTL